MSDESADYIDFKVSDWELVPKSKINEPKLIALVENASLEATSTDGNKRIVHFKRGAVIKIIKTPRGISNIWDPADVLSDTSTR
ncbi:MAG: hypothetical protein IH814_00295 [Thaumarchaeota archaeon]|nr:hypothetical protein [Nitrososphaerota archaeon]